MTRSSFTRNTEEASGQADSGLATKILETRTILLSGEVDEKLAERVMSQVVILDGLSHDPIRVLVTTQGGQVDSGYAFHDMLRFVESPIVTHGAGWVASIGVPILLS
ncbi:MAG: ATP-dependent Clp protease proteolytic subunit, partial [Planctomycetes bacterium]|nr:ATP-dependent Clp protease proteolytic subunit [Planctomycetota bacterium]